MAASSLATRRISSGGVGVAGEDLLVVGVVVLNRHVNRERVAGLHEVDGLVVQDGLVLVEMFDELGQQADQQLARWNEIVKTDLAAYNRLAQEKTIPLVGLRRPVAGFVLQL